MNYGSVCSGIEAATVAWHPWKVTPLYAAPFAAPETRQTCEWRQDSDGCYDTGCDHKFFFDTGTAEENGAKFCQYCGGAMKVIAYQEPPDEEAHVAEGGTK